MTKDNENFNRIMAGLEDAVAIAEGRADPAAFRVHVPESINVRAIRKRLGLSQVEFAARFGFALGTLRDWEQNRCAPEPTSRAFLLVIDREPEAVQRALVAA